MSETTGNSTKAERLFENQKVFWTYAELSAATSIPVSTLQKYVCSKKLTPHKFGTSVRFEPEETIRRLREIGRSHVS